jgi:hypothetical protein
VINNPNYSNESSDTTVGFLNIIHTVETIKQNYSGIYDILLNKSKVVGNHMSFNRPVSNGNIHKPLVRNILNLILGEMDCYV